LDEWKGLPGMRFKRQNTMTSCSAHHGSLSRPNRETPTVFFGAIP
jgi:hypothetical protein